VRSRDVDVFMSEVKALQQKYDLELFAFNDENFLFLKDLESFVAKWKKNIDKPFMIQTRVETITKEKLLLLKDAGCITICIGIESGDEDFRRVELKRNYSNEDVLRVFRLCAEVGIRSTANNIIGYPHETEEHILSTIKLNKLCAPDSITNAIFTPYIGCELFDVCLNEKLILEELSANCTPFYETRLQFSQEHKDMIRFYFDNFNDFVFGDKTIPDTREK
jgi:radical SAM superfamily enzyme YgiQ (UPF0313 family)